MSEEMTYVTKKALSEGFKIPVTTLKEILKNKFAIKAAKKECGIHSKKLNRIHSGKLINLKKL